MGLFSNTVMLRAGMSYEDLNNAIEQKEYKNEKQKARAQKRLTSAFASADKDNDNVLSKKEYIMQGVKEGLALGLGGVAIFGASFLGFKALEAKMLAKLVGPVLEDIDYGKIAGDAIKKLGSNINKMT